MPLAAEIIGVLPKIGERGFLFSTTGDSPISGFSHGRDWLAAAMLELNKATNAEQPKIAHFAVHDLRRTAATGMARIGIAHHVSLDRG